MSMEKQKKCRICLVENVRMYVVAHKNLQDIYEKLTDVPFVTEDGRPSLACVFCCSKLKQCYQFQRKCLKAEELFALILNDNYETKPLINQDPLEFSGGFNITPTVHISIVDVCQTERIRIKEELPDVYEGQDDIIEPKKEYQSNELEPENFENSCLNVSHIPPQQSESDLEDDVPLMEFKIEVEEEQEVSMNKQRASETEKTTVAKKPKLETRRIKLECATTAEETNKEKSDSKVIQISQKQRSLNPVQHTRTEIDKYPYKCNVCPRRFSKKCNLTNHIRKHTGEKPYKCDVCQRSFSVKSNLSQHNVRKHTGEKPHKCDVCERSFSRKCDLTEHIRIHTGEKPFKCDVCQRSFGQKRSLSGHIRIHTGEKPYNCDLCQRSFSQKCYLTEHIQTHTGGKTFKCDICERSFSRFRNLTRHILIHTSKNPNEVRAVALV